MWLRNPLVRTILNFSLLNWYICLNVYSLLIDTIYITQGKDALKCLSIWKMMSGDFWIFSVFLIAIPLAHKQSFLLVHFFRILVRFKWYWLFGLISLRNCHCCVSLILWIPSNDSYLHQGKPALAGLRGSSWSSTDSKGSSGEVISPRQVVAVCRDRERWQGFSVGKIETKLHWRIQFELPCISKVTFYFRVETGSVLLVSTLALMRDCWLCKRKSGMKSSLWVQHGKRGRETLTFECLRLGSW